MALSPPPIQAPLQDPKGGLANLQWAAWFREMWQALRTGNIDFGIAWGTLTGSIADQSDLQVALNAKLSAGRQVATEEPLTGGGFLTADLLLGVNKATITTLGVVRPDNVTIGIDGDGVLSVIAGGVAPPTVSDGEPVGEVPTGDVDNANTFFVLSQTPNPPESLRVWSNGLELRPGTDFTLIGDTVVTAAAPQVVAGLPDRLWCNYQTDSNSTSFVYAEIPAGAINGSNVVFTLADTPNPSESLCAVLNGKRLANAVLADTTLTLEEAPQAASGSIPADWLLVWYRVDGVSAGQMYNQDMDAAVDGSNTDFRLAYTPQPRSALLLYRYGRLLYPNGEDFSIIGPDITTVSAPEVGDTFRADYPFDPSGEPSPEPPIVADAIFGNNTSASDDYTAGTSVATIAVNFASSIALEDKSGNPNVAHVSEQPITRLMFDGTGAGVTCARHAAVVGWFRDGITNRGHIDVGYESNDTTQVQAQLDYLKDRGFNGASLAHYGEANTHHDQRSQKWLAQAVADGTFKIHLRFEKDALFAYADKTQGLKDELDYMEATYLTSSGYYKIGGQPVILFFDVETAFPDIDWADVRTHVSGFTNNPLFIFRNAVGYTRTESDGAFAWIDPNAADAADRYGLGYQTDYNFRAQSYGAMIQCASCYKAFDDELATWGKGRYIPHDWGLCWLETFRIFNDYWALGNQPDLLLIPTLDDYEEGTAFEMGIPSKVTILASIAGSTLNWTITGSESTIYQFQIYETPDGSTFNLVDTALASERSLVLTGLAAGPHTIYVVAEGQPLIQNRFSNGVSYTV